MNINQIKIQRKLSRKKTVFSEVEQEFIRVKEKMNVEFKVDDFLSKNECSSFFFGKEQIDQKCYICTKCDKKGKQFICDYCYKNCHKNCRNSSKENLEYLMGKEFLNIKRFSCYCGVIKKHTFEKLEKIKNASCTMMNLDQVLKISPYQCNSHNLIVCCICAVVCHKKCQIEKIEVADDELECECISDYHSNFNEMALTFPLEHYKRIANIDIWPIQILNILFSNKSTFKNMTLFFNRILNKEIDFNNSTKNIAIINKFEKLLEIFSDSFNRKFKTYYYNEEMMNMFPFEMLLNFIKNFEVVNGQTTIIKFRLLFILLFMHLRKDFNAIKSFTSNDFYCNTVLERIMFKKVLKSHNIFSYNINEKYKFNENSDIKKFVLLSLCNLIKKGMNYISVEENQDEFEIGLKLINFMLKRMIFNKNDIILLIDSIYDFHSNFYNYIMCEDNNIYSLIDIFNSLVEICFIISVYYNDLIIENYLNSKNIGKIGNFIHTKNQHSNKLLTILLKNCDLFSKHFKILIKPNLDKKSEEEIKREKKLRKHKIAMQNKILSRTTGVKTKMPENGGLFTDKIVNLFIENFSIFSLADSIYQKQLNNINDEDINNYFIFCEKIEKEDFYEIMNIEPGKYHSNILYNLKIVLEEIYYDLFTTSYVNQKEDLERRIRESILNTCDEINNNIEKFKNIYFYKKILYKFKKEEKKKKNKNDFILDDIESLKRKLLKEISGNINFANSIFLLIEEGRELIVDNLIISQIDEIIFKGMFFLTDIYFPNIINSDLIKLFFQFLSLFLLTRSGTKYIVTGKNLQIIQKLVKRFRCDEKNKNINEAKNRTIDFNINSIKNVIHFLNNLTKFIKLYDIKTIKGHKFLMKYKKSILTHLKYFSYNIHNEEQELNFKKQLKECLEIFNNLFKFYSYNEFEKIQFDIIDLFKNSHFKFLNSELFQNLFDKSIFIQDDINIKLRKYEISCYFQFFELITKNTFYVYKNDKYCKKLIKSILEFIDIQSLEKILLDSQDMISYSQKSILLKFIRTFYFIDYLDQLDYLNRITLLSNEEYKYMINNSLIKDKKIIQYLNLESSCKKNKNKDDSKIKKNFVENNNLKYKKKLEIINELIILFNIYGQEIDNFPYSINNETSICIKNYIKELIFAVHEISNKIYYNKDITNKIIPYYYKLIIKFLNRKEVFLKVLIDISNNKQKISSQDYEHLIKTENKNIDYEYITKNKFIIFDKYQLFKRITENIYEIYNKTKINEDFSLRKYLEIYDFITEANFPPFSLIEVKDYEYFYEIQDKGGGNEKEKNNNNNAQQNYNILNKLEVIKNSFLEQFRNIASTSFLGILTGDSIDKKFDFGLNFTHLFESFINSSESGNLKLYQILLCIQDKMLFYDGKHIQLLFKEMAEDNHFFKNLNRELNYYIVQCINSSKKYELCQICAEITDITKLTIQFLQLLGEGFNTEFHENILKEISENKRIQKKNLMRKSILSNKDLGKDEEEENSEESDDDNIDNIIINDIIIKKSVKFYLKQELKKTNIIPFIYPDFSIYKTMINNLKTIFHLMELNNMIEGELAFDKLCILSSNIIDFLIEYIDTKQSLISIIDDNIINLFFSNINNLKNSGNKEDYKYLVQKGVYPIFIMRIKEDENLIENENENIYNKYKLRKTMLAFMKIKYFQLLKAYLQLGKKDDFIKLLLENKIGPIKLFEEIIYYMSELINNLVNKDYEKYHNLLNINNMDSYKKKLELLYMFEEDFRASIEINVILQICIIIIIFEDIYGITMLKEQYDNEQINNIIKKKNIKEEKVKEEIEKLFIKDGDINVDSNENDNANDKKNNNIIIGKNKKVEEDNNKVVYYNNNITNNNTNNISNTIAPLKTKLPQYNHLSTSYVNLNEDLNIQKDENNNNFLNIITLKENPKLKKYKKEKELNQSLYQNIFNFYKKFIFEKIEKRNAEPKKKKTKLDKENLNLNSIFAISVYKFLFSLIKKVEINSDIDYNTNNYTKKINNRRKYIFQVTKEISQNIIDLKNNDKYLSNKLVNENSDILEENIQNISKDINMKLLDEESEEKRIAFFIKPYLSFHLSKQAKDFFLNNVDRTSAENKYKSLVLFSDYCIFEMLYNMKFINTSKFFILLSKISFYYLQVINYFLIIIENALLIYHYYKDYSLDYYEYNEIDKSILFIKFKDIVIIIVIKLLLIVFTFIIWSYFKLILEFQRNVIFHEEKNFIFFDSEEQTQNIHNPIIVEYFQRDGSLFKVWKLINRNLGFFNKIKILIFDTILFNIDINIFLLSFILNILFLILGDPLILSIEVLFIVGIFPSLINILKSFTSKLWSFCACMILNYLIVYIYNWIIIFYMRDAFVFIDIIDYKSKEYIDEPFCHSSIQCFLTLINHGIRAVGLDIVPVLSYKNDINMFIGKFIYDITFNIFVVMIMGSIPFELIVGTFGELRDEAYNYEYDKKNICFICQISRDGCLLKNIDFDKHIKEEHNLWNYINFLIYLHLNNPNDFSRNEEFVWDKILEKNLGWFPINKDDYDEDNND